MPEKYDFLKLDISKKDKEAIADYAAHRGADDAVHEIKATNDVPSRVLAWGYKRIKKWNHENDPRGFRKFEHDDIILYYKDNEKVAKKVTRYVNWAANQDEYNSEYKTAEEYAEDVGGGSLSRKRTSKRKKLSKRRKSSRKKLSRRKSIKRKSSRKRLSRRRR